ncbi:MAG: exodeoxyribonuclease III [Bacteroidia bacterium]|nr:exodeoxyribonuclease III [Bacteroidia bacterium]
MKVFSYNVNGIRAAMSKGLTDWISESGCDIICFQELKATSDQFDVNKFIEMGYNPIWNSAQKKGYSGVGLLSKQKPDNVIIGIGNSLYDDEGRVIRADFGDVTQISVYVPSGSMGDIRQAFKMDFLDAFYNYIKELLKIRPSLIISGDFNICHKPIDINHPEKHNDMSGFLPEEREWLTSFLELGLIDSFREFNSEGNQYSWWSYRQNSRMKNLGWRIDYNFVSEKLKSKLKSAEILQQVFHSDHCPVVVELL